MLATIAHTIRYKLLRKTKDQPNGIAEVHIWFRCPNCGKAHHARELTSRFNFEVVYYCSSLVTPCNENGVPIRVRMPWVTAKAIPELKRVFGEPAKILVADTRPCYAPHSYGTPAKILVAKVGE
jgi:hypothetical protein